MKVVALNGSTRGKAGNTNIALELMREELKTEGIETEIITLSDMSLNPCKACMGCKGKNKCVQDDSINEIYQKMLAADGIVIGSPTYFSNVTSRIQMLIERTGYLSRLNNDAFKGKIGAAVAVARRAGANVVYSAINYFFGLSQMPIATSSYWNVIFGREPGEIKKDTEGIQTLKNLAKNMAELMKKTRT